MRNPFKKKTDWELMLGVALLGIGAAVWGWVIGDTILKILKGKTLAVLGERKVGKSCLIEFLTKGSIPKNYKQDSYAREVSGRRIQLRELELYIPELTDLPGPTDQLHDWREITNEADIVLYLLRVDKLMKGDSNTEKRVEQDMRQISRWLRDKPKDFPLFIIGTHCDLTNPDLTALPADRIGDYGDKVRSMPIFRKIELLGGGSSKVQFVFGSLKSEASTEELVYQLFYQILRKDKRRK